MTLPDSYPITKEGECIDSLTYATILSILGRSSGYFEMKIPDINWNTMSFTLAKAFLDFKEFHLGKERALDLSTLYGRLTVTRRMVIFPNVLLRYCHFPFKL